MLIRSNRDVSVVLMIEGEQGIKNFVDIIGLDEVDVVFFGPYDLSVSLGIPGQTDDPRVADTIRDMIRIANEHHVKAGMLGINAEDANKWFDYGADYVVAVGDMALFYRVCNEMIKGVNSSSIGSDCMKLSAS